MDGHGHAGPGGRCSQVLADKQQAGRQEDGPQGKKKGRALFFPVQQQTLRAPGSQGSQDLGRFRTPRGTTCPAQRTGQQAYSARQTASMTNRNSRLWITGFNLVAFILNRHTPI